MKRVSVEIGDCKNDFMNKQWRKKTVKVSCRKFLLEIVGVVKLKQHLPCCREFRTLCIEDRVVVYVLPNFEREVACLIGGVFDQ